jgi:guanyl-specific ribonuclease Sa
MKALRKLAPILLLLLVAVFFFLPARESGTAPQTAIQEQIDLLTQTSAKSKKTESAHGESAKPSQEAASADEEEDTDLPEDGSYTSKEDVVKYLRLYGHLPSNFVTKKEAKAAGWSGGSLEKILPGKCIGGDRFGNYEGLLPNAKGRTWTECDIDTLGKNSRGAKRLVFSNDGLIYYTDDHYESFTEVE